MRPVPITRRNLLAGAAVLAATPAFAATGQHSVTDAPVADTTSAADRVSPYGSHQAGITTPRPANGMVAAFHVLASDPSALERLFRRLTERIVFLTSGGPLPEADPKLPPPDSGILGPVVQPDALTVTVGLGASLFEERTWLAELKPRVLSRMTRFHNDALNAETCHGDLLDPALRQHPGHGGPRAPRPGEEPARPAGAEVGAGRQRAGAPAASRCCRPRARATSSASATARPIPTAATRALMDRVVWVSPGSGEPAWTTGGSYVAVRIVRTLVERWDRTPLGEQERIIGRMKMSGAPLDRPDGTEAMVPDFAADPDGALTPLDAHIRLANPRTPGTEASLMLRRPFNYVNGVLKNGQLDQGLLFIAFQADLERSFIAVQRRLDREPLEEYIKPVGGGYFFALPGFAEGDYLGSSLIAALSPTSQTSSQSNPGLPAPTESHAKGVPMRFLTLAAAGALIASQAQPRPPSTWSDRSATTRSSSPSRSTRSSPTRRPSSSAVKAGDVETAKALFAPTRINYEEIEPIAELFSDLDVAIDSRADDYEKAEADPAFPGFHRIEYGLWEENSTAGLEPIADKLLADVKELQSASRG